MVSWSKCCSSSMVETWQGERPQAPQLVLKTGGLQSLINNELNSFRYQEPY